MDVFLVFQIAIYFILLIVIGSVLNRKKQKRDFSTTTKALGVSGLVIGFVMTHYGAGFILGGAELGYKNGLYGLSYCFGAALGVLLLGYVIKNKVFLLNKAKKIKTIPSFLQHKYGDEKLAHIAAYLSIFALVTIASAQLFAVSEILKILQLPAVVFPIILTLIIALVVSKGLSAVIKFGKINIAIISVGLLFALGVAFFHSQNISSQNSGFDPISLGEILAIILPTLVYTLIGQDFHQKVFSANKLSDVRKAGLFSFLALLVLGAIPVLIGMKTRFILSIDPAMAVPSFVLNVMPGVFRAVLIAAMLAAIIGSIQSVVSAAVSNIVEDILPRFKLDKKKINTGGFIASLALPFIALGITFVSNKSIVGLLVLGYSVYVAGMFAPTIFGFFDYKMKDKSNIARISSIIGIISYFVFEFAPINKTIPSIVWATIISTLFFLILDKMRRVNFIYQTKHEKRT